MAIEAESAATEGGLTGEELEDPAAEYAHGEVVRIEIARDEMERALNMEMAQRFTTIFKRLGFKYVSLDLEGYRQGSLNEVLNLKK